MFIVFQNKMPVWVLKPLLLCLFSLTLP